MEAGVSMTGVDILSKEKQIQKYVPHCRNSRQKGPVDSSEELIKWLKCAKGMRNCFNQHFANKYGTASIISTVSNSTIQYSPNRR